MSKQSHSTRQPGREPKATIMTVQAMIEHRDRFRRDVNAKDTGELSLREKQAVIDMMLQGLPITQIFYRPVTGDDGETFYLVIRGWYHLQAIFDFADNKFPTWTAEAKNRKEERIMNAEQNNTISFDSYRDGIVITTGEGQLHFHAGEAFELMKMLIRHFINRGTLSHTSMDSVFEEQWEQREK